MTGQKNLWNCTVTAQIHNSLIVNSVDYTCKTFLYRALLLVLKIVRCFEFGILLNFLTSSSKLFHYCKCHWRKPVYSYYRILFADKNGFIIFLILNFKMEYLSNNTLRFFIYHSSISSV